jgi:hypothetical protein
MPDLCRDSSCIECGGKGRIASGREVCPERRDRAAWVFWLCECGAFVSCHPGTAVPMGRPANGRTRSFRIRAHEALDRRWMRVGGKRSKHATSRSRPKAYAWLATQLGIRVEDCHIGLFDEAMCRQVISICESQARAA